MKTLEQFHRLAPQAQRRLAVVMNQHGRTSLRRLYEFLAGHKAVKDKATLYAAAFEEEYSPGKDYLLRNELRLLGAEIDEVEATEEFLKQYRGNPNFKAYWNHRVGIGHAPSITHHSEVALGLSPDPPSPKTFAYDQYVHLGDMLEMSLKQAVETSEIHSATAEDMIRAAQKLVHIRQKEAARKLAQASLIHGTALRWAHQGPDSQHFEDAQGCFDLSHARDQDPVASFLFAQFQSQCLQGMEKIVALERGLHHLSLCTDSKHFDRTGKEMGCQAMIALEWYLLGQYGKANEYYEAALAHAVQRKHPLLMAIVSNYMSNLLKGEHYAAAVAVAETYHGHLVQNPQAQFFLESLKAMCFIFLGQPSAALACVPHDIQQRRGTTYLLFRFVQALAFFLQDDADAAEREAQNIAKMIRYWKQHDRDRMKELEIDYLVIVGWLGQFFMATLQLAAERQARLDRLRSEIDRHPAIAEPLFRDFLPLKWLLQRLR